MCGCLSWVDLSIVLKLEVINISRPSVTSVKNNSPPSHHRAPPWILRNHFLVVTHFPFSDYIKHMYYFCLYEALPMIIFVHVLSVLINVLHHDVRPLPCLFDYSLDCPFGFDNTMDYYVCPCPFLHWFLDCGLFFPTLLSPICYSKLCSWPPESLNASRSVSLLMSVTFMRWTQSKNS